MWWNIGNGIILSKKEKVKGTGLQSSVSSSTQTPYSHGVAGLDWPDSRGRSPCTSTQLRASLESLKQRCLNLSTLMSPLANPTQPQALSENEIDSGVHLKRNR